MPQLQLVIPTQDGKTFTVTVDPERIVTLYGMLKTTTASPLEAVFTLAMVMRIIRANGMKGCPPEEFLRVVTDVLTADLEDLPAKSHQN